MIKRQQRIEWIAAVAKEYLAAQSAADLLSEQLRANPSYGRNKGWDGKAGAAFDENLEATYLIRLYAEFEAGLRDYWENHLRKVTHPPMGQLIASVANQHFSLDSIANANAVREYRNYLVHSNEEEPPPDMRVFTVPEAKSHLCVFFGRLDADW
jgi:hypothetical protein